MNVPNRITMFRILAVPVFMLFYVPFPVELLHSTLLSPVRDSLNEMNKFLVSYGNYAAAAIFMVASSTDAVDGYIARKTNQITKLGKFLDPIADKLLVTAALIVLVQRNQLNAWAAMIIIGRDLVVTGLRLVAAGEGQVIAASIWGKIKTLAQMVAIVAIMLDNFPFRLFTDIRFDIYTMGIALLATVYSGVDYIRKNSAVLDFRQTID